MRERAGERRSKQALLAARFPWAVSAHGNALARPLATASLLLPGGFAALGAFAVVADKGKLRQFLGQGAHQVHYVLVSDVAGEVEVE